MKNKVFYSLHTVYLLCFVAFLRDATVSGVDVVLEELVLAEGGGADRALVRQVRRLQGLAVVLGHVVQQLPLVDLMWRVMRIRIKFSSDICIPSRRLDTSHCPAPC